MTGLNIFEYCYRDAANYKVWGALLLQGTVTISDIEKLQSKLNAGEFFIAEQVGVPPLHAKLWQLSGGASVDDHVWHTFDALRPAAQDETAASIFDTVENLVAKFKAVNIWKESLSPHWSD